MNVCFGFLIPVKLNPKEKAETEVPAFSSNQNLNNIISWAAIPDQSRVRFRLWFVHRGLPYLRVRDFQIH